MLRLVVCGLLLSVCALHAENMIRGPSTAERNVFLYTEEQPVLVSGATTSTSTAQDWVLNDYSSATYDMNHRFRTAAIGTMDIPQVVSLDPTVVDDNGMRVSNGTARIQVSAGGVVKQYFVASYRYGGATTSIFDHYAPDSMTAVVRAEMAARVAGKTGLVAINGSNQWVTSHFAYPLDLTCVSLTSPRVVAVSKRFVVGAEHYSCGNPIQFLTRGNVVVTRTVVSKQNIGPENRVDGYATDTYVGMLDSDLPDTIAIAPLMPSGIEAKLPHLSSLHNLPLISWRQGQHVGISSLCVLSPGVGTVTPDGDLAAFFESKISGDSSNPAFLVLNSQPVLLTQWTFGGSGSGPSLAAEYDAIQAAMQTLAGAGFRADVDVLHTADLSGFPRY